MLIRTHVFLKQSVLTFLKEINELSISEHTRRALDDYVNKLKTKEASASASKKVGDKNGK